MQPNCKLAALTVALTALLALPGHANDRLVSGAVGVGLSYGPKFPGADKNESGVFPVLNLEIGRYGFLNQRGLGLQSNQAIGSGVLRYGLGVGYDVNSRSAKDDARLTGLPEVKAGAIATMFLEYETGAWTHELELQHGLEDKGHSGTRATLSTSYSTQVSERVGLSVTPYVTWADDAWMESFFSVTASQSAASGLAAYDAQAGLSQAGVRLSASYALRPRTILFASLDYMTLLGDAKDSSVSFEDSATSLSTGVMFRF